MQIAILIYDRLTALDAVGPYEALSRLPGATVEWVAKERGPQRTDAGLALLADRTLDEVPKPDILVVPGGFGTRAALRDPVILDWVRAAHDTSRWTTSVCTGSLILGAAGLLKGLRATSHWNLLAQLAEFGATPVTERIVRQGKVITAAGVSAGIDMALWLVGEIHGVEHARAVQRHIEYDPAPPYTAEV